MENVTRLIASLFLSFSTFLYGETTTHNTCSAAFINTKMIADQYTTKGKCAVSANATSMLAIYTVELNPGKCNPKDKIDFKIAIRDKQTQTLTMYSDETFKQADINQVLQKCKRGEKIILLTTKAKYALPHNEILVY
jgi:hypothetical protein